MRDTRFIAKHRGGPLNKEQHYQLMKWAIACSQHVLHLCGQHLDIRLINALEIATLRINAKVPVGQAMKASVSAHTLARELSDPIAVAIARSIGQGVATAHMADHALGAAIYALKAIKYANQSVEQERNWQNKQLPPEIRELVLSTRTQKEQGFKDLRI